MDTLVLPIVLIPFGKIMLAGVLAGIIGYERAVHGQAAGFRTNVLVAVGACLMMMLSIYMESMFRTLDAGTVVRLDPTRIASYAIASMGFLGAGAIIKGKGHIKGLTTAAGLWLVTGIGLAVGAGFYTAAILTTLVSVFILYVLRRGLGRFIHQDTYSILRLTCGPGKGRMAALRQALKPYALDVLRTNYHHDMETGETVYMLRLRSKEDLDWARIVLDLQAVPTLKRIDWEEAEVP